MLLQSVAGAAVASGIAHPASLPPLAAPLVVEPAASATPATLPAPPPASLAPAEAVVTASSPQAAILQARQGSTIGALPDLPPPGADGGASGGRTTLSDTDNNTINDARWLNGSASRTGESVEGRNDGMNRRTDVDWWRFPLANTTFSAADVMEFDIQKQAGEHLFAVVCDFPSFDPNGFDCRFNSNHILEYAYMNGTQGWGTNTHMKVTGFEDGMYFLYLYSPLRNGCCLVNYSILNISDYTVTGDTSIDDNSNSTTADVFNPSAMPTNQEVVENADAVDLFDLTASVPITPTMGDYSRVSISAQFFGGTTGWSEFFNSTQSPAVASSGDTRSYATLWLLYPDRFNNWHVFTSSATPGGGASITTLVNGTPIYAAVTVTSYIDIPGINPISSVPGSARYNFTGFTHLENLAPRAVSSLPDTGVNEDDPASGTDLLDLAPYFSDDHSQGALWFDLSYNQQPTKMFVNFTGSLLQVRTATDYHGTVMLQVRVHDLGLDGIRSGDDISGTSNYFDVVVAPVNDPPRIATLGGAVNVGSEILFTMNQGDALAIDVTVVDPDGPEVDTFAVPSLPAFATFYPSNGTVVFQPGNADVGTYHFVETVSDPALASGNASFGLTVLNVNDDPHFIEVGGQPVAPSLVFFATEDQPFALVLKVADPDWDIGVRDRLIFSSDKPFFTFTADPLDGRINTTHFTPTNAQVGTLVVVFTVTDGAAGTTDDSVAVSVVVENANDPPRLTKVGTVTQDLTIDASKSVNLTGVDGATQGRAFPMTVRATDDDVTAGWADALTFSTDQGARFHISANPDFVSADISFTPNQTDAVRGYVIVHIRVTDAGVPSFFDEITVRIDITNVNDPPVLAPVFSLNLTEGEAFAYVFEATDPDGDPISFVSDSTILPVDSTTGSIEVTPTNDQIDGEDAQFDMTVTARDNHAGVTTMVVHVFIHNTNQAPSGVQILSPPDLSAWAAGEGITFQAAGTDIDKADADHLVFRWFADEVLLGDGRTFVKGIENPDAAPKSVTVRLQVIDPQGASTNLTRALTVNGTPAPPKSPGFEAPFVALGLVGAAALVGAAKRARSGRQK